ncbi:MAG: AlkZ-related protein [Bdellovibrionota bacterium]
MNRKSAVSAIERAGALLVFPMDNRKEPASIWSHFYPRTKMRWEWDESGDNRVGELWALRGELSTTRQVVYTKWFRGRATYFSKPLFTALLRSLNREIDPRQGLSECSRRILSILEGESPLSTKELKRQADLGGRANEAAYSRAMKELWDRLLVVAYGEVEDGAFPSLAVGATGSLFEELWRRAFELTPEEADRRVADVLPEKNLFYRHYLKLRAAAARPAPGRRKAASAAPIIDFKDL